MSELDNKLEKLFAELDAEVRSVEERLVQPKKRALASFSGSNKALQVILADPVASHLILERR